MSQNTTSDWNFDEGDLTVITDDTLRKFFKGQAVALGGHLRHPIGEPVPSQASAAIPLSGGLATSRVEGFNHREIVSFKSAHTLVSGGESNGKLETLVTTVIEGLDILGVITADKIVGRLVGSLPVKKGANPKVTPSGSYFQNLRICGEPVECRFIGNCFDDVVCDDKYPGSLANNATIGPQLLPAKGWADKGFAPISLCADVSTGKLSCKPTANQIDIPHLGRIYLSEFLVSRTSHRLTMLRVELGCPVRASLDACAVEGEPFIMP
jgi:hypothetical protein